MILGEKFLSNVMNTRYFTTTWAPENPQSINSLLNNDQDCDRKVYYDSGQPSLAGFWTHTTTMQTHSHMEGTYTGPRVTGTYTVQRDNTPGEFEARALAAASPSVAGSGACGAVPKDVTGPAAGTPEAKPCMRPW